MAKIYGSGGKPLTKYQSAINEASVEISKQQPEIVFDKGSLLQMARNKVVSDGYTFAKGFTRGKDGESSESEPESKRKKKDDKERAREIKLLQENLHTLTSRLQYKQNLLEKARTVNKFKQCDEICAEIVKVRNERASIESQLHALQKREAKSSWYHKKKHSKKSAQKPPNNEKSETKSGKRKECSQPSILKHLSSTSSDGSTIILNEEDEDSLMKDVDSELAECAAEEKDFT